MSKEQRKKKIVEEFTRILESVLDEQGNGKTDSLWNIIKERRLKETQKFGFEITIGDSLRWKSGLYGYRISEFEAGIALLRSLQVDFEKKTLEGLGCFLHQLNHEILHTVLSKLFGMGINFKLDHWRHNNPRISTEYYPFI